MHITIGTLVLIRLLMKADVMETTVKIERFVKINFDLGKNGCHRPMPEVEVVGHSLWSGSE